MSEKSTLAAVARASTETAVQPAAAVQTPTMAPATIAPPAPAAPVAPPLAAEANPPDATAAAVAAAKQRISAIMGLPAAKGREALAQQIALTTDLPVEQAAALLGASPEAKASGFDATMRAGGNPDLGSGAPKATTEQQVGAMWADSIARANKTLGARATKH